jgi:hemerythrin superfamily protein
MPDTGTTTNAVTMLKADHRTVEELFEQFEKARKSDAKEAIVEKIIIELAVHSTIEEEIFYPACKRGVDDDMLDEAHVEHDEAKVLMAELIDATPEDSFYDAKVTVLSELIKHHVHEEEMRDGIFAQARETKIDLEALGAQMQARKQELMAEIEASGVPALKTRTFSGHQLEQGEPVDAAE